MKVEENAKNLCAYGSVFPQHSQHFSLKHPLLDSILNAIETQNIVFYLSSKHDIIAI